MSIFQPSIFWTKYTKVVNKTVNMKNGVALALRQLNPIEKKVP